MKALVTGIRGSDGWYMAQHLLANGYEVVGTYRGYEPPNQPEGCELAPMDLTDLVSIEETLKQVQPREIYNFAAQTHVQVSFLQPLLTMDVNGMGPVRLFEAARRVCPGAKIFQASTSEMYGPGVDLPITLETEMKPDNPYGCAKLYAHQMAELYRQAYGMYIACAISFNHTSPRQSEMFVANKFARAAAEISRGKRLELTVGNIDSEREIGWGPEYCEAYRALLSEASPSTRIICTGMPMKIRDYLDWCFTSVGLGYKDWITFDQKLLRPLDRVAMVGSTSDTTHHLGWASKLDGWSIAKMLVQSWLDRM
jgi:GDPmannose 4,6-dehydratase